MFEHVPNELKSLRQWVTWRYETRGEKQTKVLTVPETGYRASSTNPNTWRTFEEATACNSQIGFVFTPNDSLFGLDIDGVITDGVVHPKALEILEKFPGAYVEKSPSGTGLHVYGNGEVGRGRRSVFIKDITPGVDSIIEMYDRARYFTVTGDIFFESFIEPLRNYQNAINELLKTVFTSASLSQSGESSNEKYATIEIELVENPSPPFKKFQLISHAKPEWTPTWEMTRKMPNENSFSEYDLSLADMMAQFSWTAQEICDTLRAFRIYHNMVNKEGRLGYYQRTIYMAFEAAERKQALEQLQLGATGSPEESLAMITHITGLDVVRYIQSGRDPGSYRVILSDGDVCFLGAATHARSQATWQTVAQEKTGVPFERVQNKAWQQLLVCLGRIVEREDVGESTTLDTVMSALYVYTESCTDVADYHSVRSGYPFMEDGKLFISMPHFLRWYRNQQRGRIADADFLSILRQLGSEPMQVHKRDKGKQAVKRYWGIPLTQQNNSDIFETYVGV